MAGVRKKQDKMSKYQRVTPVSKEYAETQLNLVTGEELCLLLLGLCEQENWEWAQSVYLKYIYDDDHWVASAAITGLGHLARISGQLDKETVVKSLTDLIEVKPSLEGKVHDTLNDIEMFL
ncbi:hypothetical protein J8M21_23160 [Pseudoalteromonas luteoviolacea]|uniref:hypothetical protein n=1 Tax=Pseudoalteromonas luteoviolacea TaxID=43657 RepID=UPI001B39FA34|nr:hypothetical protein [Pseudoalteromonas luteoviolacea]MBQ4880115.1 hypothetical protein [Pseudoalteromonas luteoviolacea]MBQ4909132.1 hypothetical protein [Pseudoalteromonas luteoviolacea]